MSHTIQYQGDATVAVDAVLDYLANDDFDGDWYVEIDTRDGEEIGGYVEAFSREARPPTVTIGMVNNDIDLERTGETRELDTDDISTLVVP